MGFDFKTTSSSSPEEQLSLLDFQLSQEKFIEDDEVPPSPSPSLSLSSSSNSDVEFERFMATINPRISSPPKTGRFITLSASFHVAALILITIFAVPLVQEVKPETISIEIQDEPPSLQQAQGVDVPANQGAPADTQEVKAAPAIVAAKEPAMDDDSAPAVAAPQPAPAPKAKAVAHHHAAPKIKAVAVVPAQDAPVKTARTVAPKTTMAAVPTTLDDINAPALDAGAVAEAPVNSEMHEDLNQDFEKVDESQAAKIEKERGQIAQSADQVAAEQEESLKAVDELNKEDAEKLAALKDSVHNKDTQAIAAAEASEKAAAEAKAAAATKAAAAAASAARANAAKQAQARAKEAGTGTAAGAGAGDAGENKSSADVAGIPQGVRTLDQLRQMPNNPHPQYAREERHAGQQGEISFVAYINKSGVPSQFKIMKSTGYQNLDAKTLAALKKWRFYPGQEGWVELPFKWDLRGGVQEDGGTLRRSIGSR